MNQLVRVSRPLYFLLLLSFCYGFFKPSALSAGSRSGVAAGEHLPRRHAASGPYPCGGKPYGGQVWQCHLHRPTEGGVGSRGGDVR